MTSAVVTKPVVGPMSFDACMSRSWPGIEDKAAFCATMERGELSKVAKMLAGAVIANVVKSISAINDPPADSGVHCVIKSVNQEKRLLTVITNTLTDDAGNPIADHQGDVIDIDNLEEVFIKSFARGGEGMGDEMHDESDAVDVVQHFTLSCDERVALGFGEGPALGIAKLFVRDDALWEKAKSGERPEVSIAGDGERFAL